MRLLTMPRHAKATKIARDRQMIRAIRHHFKGLGKLTLGRVEYTRDELVAFFEKHLEALRAIDLAATEWQIALRQEAAMEKDVLQMVIQVQALARTLFDPADTVLREFGRKPSGDIVKSAAVKALAAKKGMLTRAARHTMGKRQKEKIKGW